MPDEPMDEEDQPIEIECPHCQETMAEETTGGQTVNYCENADCDWQPGCTCDLCTGEAKKGA